MRLLMEFVRTPYILWMDDDSHLTSPDWAAILSEFINTNTFDCAGHVFYCNKHPEYNEFLRKRPWWRGEEFFLETSHSGIVWFATGGLFLVKTDLLRTHNFPDKGMIKRQDDLLLGDLISQWHKKLINFPSAFMDCIRISDGTRRGSGEGSDGWTQG